MNMKNHYEYEYENKGWQLIKSYRSAEKIKLATFYGSEYLEPVLESFTQLKGRVYVAVNSYGFVLNLFPKYSITVCEQRFADCSPYKIRFITAHFLMQTELYEWELIKGCGDLKTLNHRALRPTIERGFGDDFIKTFQNDCKRSVCDGKYKFCDCVCGEVFEGCCRGYMDTEAALVGVCCCLKI